MYRASIPVFIRGLKVLSALLEKGAAHAAEAGIDPDALIEARLAPDMIALAGQVQRVSDTAKLSAQRLSGVVAPSMPDEEKTFAELQERVAKTIAYLETVTPAAMEGAETRTIEMNFGEVKPTFSGEDYLFGFGLPNFYFHVTTAYAILRNQGVKVGKLDFLGSAS
jgi:hypothetical protein